MEIHFEHYFLRPDHWQHSLARFEVSDTCELMFVGIHVFCEYNACMSSTRKQKVATLVSDWFVSVLKKKINLYKRKSAITGFLFRSSEIAGNRTAKKFFVSIYCDCLIYF